MRRLRRYQLRELTDDREAPKQPSRSSASQKTKQRWGPYLLSFVVGREEFEAVATGVTVNTQHDSLGPFDNVRETRISVQTMKGGAGLEKLSSIQHIDKMSVSIPQSSGPDHVMVFNDVYLTTWKRSLTNTAEFLTDMEFTSRTFFNATP